MFNIDVTDVGNPMILGAMEEELEAKVEKLIGYIGHHMGFQTTQENFEWLARDMGIDYDSLPAYLKEEIDDKVWIIDDDDCDMWCW